VFLLPANITHSALVLQILSFSPQKLQSAIIFESRLICVRLLWVGSNPPRVKAVKSSRRKFAMTWRPRVFLEAFASCHICSLERKKVGLKMVFLVWSEWELKVLDFLFCFFGFGCWFWLIFDLKMWENLSHKISLFRYCSKFKFAIVYSFQFIIQDWVGAGVQAHGFSGQPSEASETEMSDFSII
jgi:hypothetical protein